MKGHYWNTNSFVAIWFCRWYWKQKKEQNLCYPIRLEIVGETSEFLVFMQKFVLIRNIFIDFSLKLT